LLNYGNIWFVCLDLVSLLLYSICFLLERIRSLFLVGNLHRRSSLNDYAFQPFGLGPAIVKWRFYPVTDISGRTNIYIHTELIPRAQLFHGQTMQE
jgi:hypothetical protein